VKTYKTSSGTYTEAELAVVVWRSPKNWKSSQARFLETMTAEDSPHPMAFPIASLTSKKEWAHATRISSLDDIMTHASGSSRINPMIVPLPVAESAFGWSTFYIPTEYTE
jgi:hypothetical protein